LNANLKELIEMPLEDGEPTLDAYLADPYVVETKGINEQVRRNSARFSEDFLFQLTVEELDALRSQFVTLKPIGRGG
jgi:ORF6N domain